MTLLTRPLGTSAEIAGALCCPRIGANGLRLGGGLRGSLLGGPYQRVGDRFHDRLLVRPDRGTRFPLKPPRHHVVNDLLDGPRPLVGQDVRQLVNDDDIAAFHEHVLTKLELRLEECGADLRIAFGSA